MAESGPGNRHGRWQVAAIVAMALVGCGREASAVLAGPGWRLTTTGSGAFVCAVLRQREASARTCGPVGGVMANRLDEFVFGFVPEGATAVWVGDRRAAVVRLSSARVTAFVARSRSDQVIARDNAGRVLGMGWVAVPPRQVQPPPPGRRS